MDLGGVHGSLADWREILLPLLLLDQKDGKIAEVKQTGKACKR
jgi:hypothetical protein